MKSINKVRHFIKYYFYSILIYYLIYLLMLIPSSIILNRVSDMDNVSVSFEFFQFWPFVLIVTLYPVIYAGFYICCRLQKISYKDVSLAIENNVESNINDNRINYEKLKLLNTDDSKIGDEKGEEELVRLNPDEINEKIKRTRILLNKCLNDVKFEILDTIMYHFTYSVFNIEDIKNCKNKKLLYNNHSIISTLAILQMLGIIEEDEEQDRKNTFVVTPLGRKVYDDLGRGGNYYE